MSTKYENAAYPNTHVPTPTEAVFNSVAAEEYQLANLIEQEAEKISQILCMKPCLKELFELNDRIDRFLTGLILKEVVLAVKLNEALTLLNGMVKD